MKTLTSRISYSYIHKLLLILGVKSSVFNFCEILSFCLLKLLVCVKFISLYIHRNEISDSSILGVQLLLWFPCTNVWCRDKSIWSQSQLLCLLWQNLWSSW